MTAHTPYFLSDGYVTMQEGARLLGVSVKTLRRRVSQGHLPAYRLANGRSLRVRLEDVENLAQRVPTAKVAGAVGPDA